MLMPKKGIMDRIAKDFDELKTLVDKYENYRAVDNFQKNFNFKEWN